MINFTEKQRFTQWWVWMILISIATPIIIGVFKQLILRQPFGGKPMSDLGLILFAILVFVFVSFFIIMRLDTVIDSSGIKMYFVPLVKREVKWEDVKSLSVVNYGFVGGWGIRFGSSYGTIYNVKGKMGIAIELRNGKKFLIGTQKPEEIQRIIDRYFNKKSEEIQ